MKGKGGVLQGKVLGFLKEVFDHNGEDDLAVHVGFKVVGVRVEVALHSGGGDSQGGEKSFVSGGLDKVLAGNQVFFF